MKGNLRWPLTALAIAAIVALTTSASAASLQSDLAWPGPVYSSYFGCIHIVRLGETLNGIAARYGTTRYALMQANYIPNPNVIYSGAPLRVPCSQTAYPTSCVRATYVVRPGDDLFRIGLRFGVSPSAISFLNGLGDRNLIFAGMRLAIPCYNANRTGYPPSYTPGYPSTYPTYPPSTPAPNMPTPTPTSGQVTVVMQNIAFNPSTLTIHVGQTVVWRNNDAAPHTTTSGSCSGNVCTPMPGWDSGTLTTGQSFSHLFNSAGTFTYYCKIHGAMMQGTVVVQ